MSPRYKLRVPEPGDALFGDGMAVVADTIEEARDAWEHETGARPLYMHSSLGRCRVVYAHDIENGDAHEDAEPGDTTVDYFLDDGRDPAPGEIRVWEDGAPRLCDWRGVPTERVCDTGAIPIGTVIDHARLGAGALMAKAWKDERSDRWRLLLRFGSRPGHALVVSTSGLHLAPTLGNWHPPAAYRLEVDGELLAVTHSDWAFSALLDMRETRLRLEWEAEHFDEEALFPATTDAQEGTTP